MRVPIKKNIFELIEMKSKFISLIYPINNLDDFNKIINEVKGTYKDATHYLYAYSISNKMKCNNDGEPGNIAKRFLELFNLMKIDNVLVIVVRYFGGVKLGASNLLRTYVKSVSEALKTTEYGEISDLYLYKVECDYQTFNNIKKLGYQIENIKYLDTITLDIISNVDIINNLKEIKDIKINCEKIKRVC